MKEREENRIKELFHELKQEDERRAPAFARILEAALSGSAKTRQPWPVLPVAVAAAMLILVGVFVFTVSRQSATETYQAESSSSEPVAPLAEPPAPGLAVSAPHKNESPNKPEPTRSARRRVAQLRRLSPTLISEWHSPTDFLLETSGWQLLRTTPRVDESITSIKGLFPEEMN
jgi:hypothetical protein